MKIYHILFAVVLLVSCTARKTPTNVGNIHEDGLAEIKLNTPLSEVNTPEWAISVRDTSFSENGFEWLGKWIQLESNGYVLIEGDYVESGDPGNRLATTPVNRIRVQSTSFVTSDSIRVGDKLSDIQRRIKKKKWTAYYIPNYDRIDLSQASSAIHLTITDPGGLIAGHITPKLEKIVAKGGVVSMDDLEIPIKKISEKAVVESIVVLQ